MFTSGHNKRHKNEQGNIDKRIIDNSQLKYQSYKTNLFLTKKGKYMKKLSIIATGLLGLGCLCADDSAVVKQADWQSKLSGNVGLKFETEHVNRGRREIPNRTFVPSAEVSYQLFDTARAYVGTEAALRIENNGINDVAPYIGCMYDINDMFTVDLGYTHHFYSRYGVKTDSSEPYIGLLADIMFDPSLYIEYDCKAEEFHLIGTIGYNFDLSQYVINGLGADIGIKFGYIHCNKPGGDHYDDRWMGNKDYTYCEINADLVYSITNSAQARAGVAYAGNSAKKESWTNSLSETNSMIWFNASVDYTF